MKYLYKQLVVGTIVGMCIVTTAESICAFDTFYVNLKENGDIESISTEKTGKFPVAIFKEFSSEVTLPQDKTEEVCHENISSVCFKQRVECIKGLLYSTASLECNSPFYSITSGLAATVRDKDGEVSVLGTVVATAIAAPIVGVFGGVYTEKTFNDTYNETIKEYELDVYKKNILSAIKENQLYRPCNVAKNKGKSFEVTEDGCTRNINEGLFVFYRDNNFFEADFSNLFEFGLARVFNKTDKNTKFLTILSSDDLKDITLATQKITQLLVNRYMDFSSQFPKVPLPIKLPEIVLTKGEFEKLSDFQKRKSQVQSQRVEDQRKINEEYISRVKDRNQRFFDESTFRKNKINSKIADFQKETFIALAEKPKFEYLAYDPEAETLYANITTIDNKKQKILLKVPPKRAESIKALLEQVSVKLIFSAEKQQISLDKIDVSHNGDHYDAQFTDIKYKPDFASVIIPSYDIAQYNKNIEDVLSQATNLNQAAMVELQNLEKWRIVEAKNISEKKIKKINAASPPWYSDTTCLMKQCAIARSESQEGALKNAMAQLGCIMDSTIKSTFIISKEKTSNYIKDKKDHYIEQKCNHNFNKQDIRVLHLEERDGWYYIKIGI